MKQQPSDLEIFKVIDSQYTRSKGGIPSDRFFAKFPMNTQYVLNRLLFYEKLDVVEITHEKPSKIKVTGKIEGCPDDVASVILGMILE